MRMYTQLDNIIVWDKTPQGKEYWRKWAKYLKKGEFTTPIGIRWPNTRENFFEFVFTNDLPIKLGNYLFVDLVKTIRG